MRVVCLCLQSVCEGDVSAVKDLLEQSKQEADAAKASLCHPLCVCEKCAAVEERYAPVGKGRRWEFGRLVTFVNVATFPSL